MDKIAYIASGKNGIHRFTYNELNELQNIGIEFKLCLTQINPGPWMPEPTWAFTVATRRKALQAISFLLFTQPKLFFHLLKNSLNQKTIPYFVVALSFYQDMKKDKNIKVLHCQIADKKIYIGYYLKRLMNLPLTVTLHSHELYQKDKKNEIEIKPLLSYCDKIITISEFNFKIIKGLLGDNSSEVELMRLFPTIDTYNKVQNKSKILIVASWVEKKGFKTLFKAISEIDREDFVLWVVGGDSKSTSSIDLNQLAKDYNVEDKIALLGKHGGVVLDIIYLACDIFCLPSFTVYYPDGTPETREGIPVALMEAMAWGKPVISTKHAGIPELVKDILVEENNVSELKNAICYLLDHPEKWNRMGEINKSIIVEKYSTGNVKILNKIFKGLYENNYNSESLIDGKPHA